MNITETNRDTLEADPVLIALEYFARAAAGVATLALLVLALHPGTAHAAECPPQLVACMDPLKPKRAPLVREPAVGQPQRITSDGDCGSPPKGPCSLAARVPKPEPICGPGDCAGLVLAAAEEPKPVPQQWPPAVV